MSRFFDLCSICGLWQKDLDTQKSDACHGSFSKRDLKNRSDFLTTFWIYFEIHFRSSDLKFLVSNIILDPFSYVSITKLTSKVDNFNSWKLLTVDEWRNEFGVNSHLISYVWITVWTRCERGVNHQIHLFIHSSTVKRFQLYKVSTFDVNFVILKFEKGSKMIFETRNFRSEDLKWISK